MQVLGIWKPPDDQPLQGFTLVLRRCPEGWKTIHDHTSKTPDAPEQP